MVLTKTFSSEMEWLRVLSDYTDATRKKTYKRIAYHTWQTITPANITKVIVEKPGTSANEIKVKVYSKPNPTLQSTLFLISDHSFGQFLYDKCFKEEEKKKLMASYKIANYDIDDQYLSSVNTICNTASTSGTISIPGYSDLTTALDDLTASVNDLQLRLNQKVDIQDFKKKDGNETMKGFNFDFGPCNSNTVKMSMYGLAIKNSAGNWVSYDSTSKSIMDVDILNFDGAKFLYKMPVAINDIKAGDVVVHNGFPMFVLSVNNGGIEVIDPHAGEKKTVLLTKSPFGFDFATKVVNLLNGMTAKSADAANPFGNMWMFMMLGDNKDFSDIAPLMMMQQGGNFDPMMMYFMMSGNKSHDVLPLLFMMNANKTNNCNCKGACAEVSAN